MLKFLLISGVVTYIFAFIFSHDVEKEFIRRYGKKPISNFELSKEISSLIICFTPIVNILMILAIVFDYNKTAEKMIEILLEKEEKYNK